MNPTTTLPRTLTIELLAIDLSTCSRCTGSLANLEQAIATLQPILASTGTAVEFHKILVESEAQQLRFVSSPTIRINGQDVSLETTESRCGDCSEISGSQGGTACRTWSYQGESYTEAPIGMFVDAMLALCIRLKLQHWWFRPQMVRPRRQCLKTCNSSFKIRLAVKLP